MFRPFVYKLDDEWWVSAGSGCFPGMRRFPVGDDLGVFGTLPEAMDAAMQTVMEATG